MLPFFIRCAKLHSHVMSRGHHDVASESSSVTGRAAMDTAVPVTVKKPTPSTTSPTSSPGRSYVTPSWT